MVVVGVAVEVWVLVDTSGWVAEFSCERMLGVDCVSVELSLVDTGSLGCGVLSGSVGSVRGTFGGGLRLGGSGWSGRGSCVFVFVMEGLIFGGGMLSLLLGSGLFSLELGANSGEVIIRNIKNISFF